MMAPRRRHAGREPYEDRSSFYQRLAVARASRRAIRTRSTAQARAARRVAGFLTSRSYCGRRPCITIGGA